MSRHARRRKQPIKKAKYGVPDAGGTEAVSSIV